MDQGRIVTFGEIMLRLTAPRGSRFLQSEALEPSWAGSEANVAAGLASLLSGGAYQPSFVTALPDNDLGRQCQGELRRLGVHTGHTALDNQEDSRMGLLFLEQGVMMRPSRVIYDRRGSAFSRVTGETFNWGEILSDAAWFHLSGITPALSPGTEKASRQAVQTAAELGVPVSVDLNYRRTLWESPAQAQEVMGGIFPYAQYLIGNEEDYALMVTNEEASIQNSVKAQAEQFTGTAEKVYSLYPQLRGLFSSIRIARSAEHNEWAGASVLPPAGGGTSYLSRTHDLRAIQDRVGAGDAFAAGVVFSLLKDYPLQRAVEFAAAAGALKHTIQGDFLRATKNEIEAAAKASAAGSRIQR